MIEIGAQCKTPSQPSVPGRRQLSTPPFRYCFPVPHTDSIQAINPASRGDLRRH
jgi:hypothetical protein